MQVVTPVEVQVSFVVVPLVNVVGLAVRVTVGATVWSTGSVTDTAKGGRSALVVPSLVLMTMLEYEPTSVVAGVPEICPVVVSKRVHRGALRTLNVSEALLGLLTVGRNEYCCSAWMAGVGVPVIDSAVVAASVEAVVALEAVESSPPHALRRVVSSSTEAQESEGTARKVFIIGSLRATSDASEV